MSAYAERRKGKLTGKFIGECLIAGDRFRKRFDTLRDAERWADHVKVQGAPPADTAANPGMTWGALVDAYKAANKPGRDHSAGQRLEYVADTIGRDLPLSALTTIALDKLVRSLLRRPGKKGRLGPATINRYLSAASSVITFGKQRGHLQTVPVVPWQAEEGGRIHWLTEEQEEVVCGLLPERYAFAVRVLVATGMRWGEFEGLEADQVEIRNENAWVRLWKTKTDSPRSIPLSVVEGRQLRAMVEAGDLPGYQAFRNSLKGTLEAAGQSPEFCIHCLRHTTATRLLQRGVALAIVQKFLGHKSIETTLKYTHIVDEDLANAANKLSQHAGHLPSVAGSDPMNVLEAQ